MTPDRVLPVASGRSSPTAADRHADRPDVQAAARDRTPTLTGRSSGADLPAWFHVGTVTAAVLMATIGVVGLLLAINGWYRTWLVLLLCVPLTAALVFGLFRRRPHATVTRVGQIGAALALTIAVGYAAFAGATPGQHVLVDRDPGAYAMAGRWIAQSGSIDVDAKGDAFEGIDGLMYRSSGTYNVPPPPRRPDGAPGVASGNIQIQFNHLASAVLAAAYDIGGSRLFFRAPALAAALALLLLYAVSVKATARPLLSLAAPLLLAAGLPLLNVARDTYSEPFAMVLLWGGLLVLLDAHDRPRPWVGLVGGVLLGGVAGARVDALVYVIIMFPLAAVSIGAARTHDVRKARAVAWGVAAATMILVSTVGWVDLTRHAGSYATDLSKEIDQLQQAAVASIVVSAVGLAIWLALPALRRLGGRIQRPLAWAGALVVLLSLLGLWLVRPEIQEVKAPYLVSTTRGIQKRDGLTVEPRSYADISMRWMAWYLGIPALVAAIAGLTIAAWRTLRGRATSAVVAVGALTLGGGAVYWWDPSITPSHPWASRRFVPAVFPGLTVMAVVAIAAIAALPLLRRRRSAIRWAVAAVAFIALIVPAAATTWPLRWQRSMGGFLRPVTETCDGMTGNPAVIVAGAYESLAIQQTLRSWCGVPVAAQGSAFDTPQSAREIASTLRDRGYTLYLVGANRQAIDNWAAQVGGTPAKSSSAWERYEIAETLVTPPNDYVDPERALPGRGPFRLFRLRVEPDTG